MGKGYGDTKMKRFFSIIIATLLAVTCLAFASGCSNDVAKSDIVFRGLNGVEFSRISKGQKIVLPGYQDVSIPGYNFEEWTVDTTGLKEGVVYMDAILTAKTLQIAYSKPATLTYNFVAGTKKGGFTSSNTSLSSYTVESHDTVVATAT
ncbi:MAG: hypothetical protein MJ072_03335 [Clostridia bacterium]|nr:hypothetical protein [Clostridia bacterium]